MNKKMRTPKIAAMTTAAPTPIPATAPVERPDDFTAEVGVIGFVLVELLATADAQRLLSESFHRIEIMLASTVRVGLAASVERELVEPVITSRLPLTVD
jgi:hypothetical protein